MYVRCTNEGIAPLYIATDKSIFKLRSKINLDNRHFAGEEQRFEHVVDGERGEQTGMRGGGLPFGRGRTQRFELAGGDAPTPGVRLQRVQRQGRGSAMEEVSRTVQESAHLAVARLRFRVRLHETVRRRVQHHRRHCHCGDRRLRAGVPFGEVAAGAHQTRTALMSLVLHR